MFLVDISPSMGKMRAVEIPGPSGGDAEVIEMTNLEWSLQFVMLKIQEMVCPTREARAHPAKTDSHSDLQWTQDRQVWRHPLRQRGDEQHRQRR